MLKIDSVSFSYGKEKILDSFSLDLPNKGVFSIMGPSGCGKSTLFSIIGGLLKPTSGTVEHDFRRIAFAFQDARLMPWMTAAENVNYVIGGKKSTLEAACKALTEVGLDGSTEKYPSELSGGMKKRVSLARAFAYDGDFLLLDEPLTGIDDEMKERIIEKLVETGKEKLVLMITHDISEAEKCSEEIFDFYKLMKKQ